MYSTWFILWYRYVLSFSISPFSTVRQWIIQKYSWHMAPLTEGLMWLDLPGFPPTLSLGSIVPLNETSWLSPVWAHVAAIDGWHAISPTGSSRPPRGCRNHWKDSSTSSQTWPRHGAICTVSTSPILSPCRSSSTSVDPSYSLPAHTYTFSPPDLSVFIFSFSPAAFLGDCCQLVCW